MSDFPESVCINTQPHPKHLIAGTWRTECPGLTKELRGVPGDAYQQLVDGGPRERVFTVKLRYVDPPGHGAGGWAQLNQIEDALRAAGLDVEVELSD